METLINQQISGKSPSKVQSLVLTNFPEKTIKDISGISESYINLYTLTIKDAGITNLKGLPKLPKLKHLNLESNQLDGEDLESLIENCPKLTELNLSENPIQELSKLEPLAKLENLVSLELTGTAISKLDDYATKVFEILPNLSQLDGKTREGLPADEDEEDEEADSDEDDDDDDGSGSSSDDEEPNLLKNLLGGDMEDDEDDFEGDNAEGNDDEDDDDEDDDEDVEEGALSPDKVLPKGQKRKQREDEE